MKKINMLILLVVVITMMGCGKDSDVVEESEKISVSFAERGDGTDWGPDEEEIVGISDKDFLDVTEGVPHNVRGDDSGDWKKMVISKGVNMEEFAISYHDTHMAEDETHYIIDFGRNTTSSISYLGGTLYVNVMEYVEKEEHDIKKIGSGMVLQTFRIYPNRGIEAIDIND